MKATTAILFVSLAANAALTFAWLRSPTPSDTAKAPPASTPAAAAPTETVSPPPETTAASKDPAALRDRLHALGFSDSTIRAAVRAVIEAPRLAREKSLRTASIGQPWWRPGPATSAFSAAQTRELRELRKAEQEEIARVLGPGGSATTTEIERYAYLPEEKAAQVAVIDRDYYAARRELPTGSGAPATRAETLERQTALKAEHDRALAAILTPEEREQVEMRMSNTAFNIGLKAPYFDGTEEDYRKIYALEKPAADARDALDAMPLESRGRAGIDASQKLQTDLQAALGADRYKQWQRAQQADYTALIELQRRFSLPQATIDAVAAVPRQISDEGMLIARDNQRPTDEKLTELSNLANEGRKRVRAILGDDLGDAYNAASARDWLDPLERGMVPFYLPNGQRALSGVGGRPPGFTRTAPSATNASPPPPAPKR